MKQENKGWEIDLLPINESQQSGDCILLRFGDLYAGKQQQCVFVVDGGFSDTHKAIKKHLDTYYNCYYDNAYHITYVILTHPDQDHISGLVELLKDDSVKIENLIVNAPWETLTPDWFKDGRITNKSLEKELQDVFEKLAILIEMAKSKHSAKIWYGVDHLGSLACNDAKITILGPSKLFYNWCITNSNKTCEKAKDIPNINTYTVNSQDREEEYIPGRIDWPQNDSTSEINESSIVFLFEYPGIKILFTGDCGRKGLAQAMKYADDNSIDLSDVQIIKMPHHGSRHNIDMSFLNRFSNKKRTCYISCTKNDEGHHPSKRLVNLLNEKGFKVVSTSGSTLHRGHNAPERGWKTAKPLGCYPTIEKLDL